MFGFTSVLTAVGVEWDIYDSVVSNDVAIRKGHSLEAVFPQLQQILGRLDSMNPDDEFPATAKVLQQQQHAGTAPVTIYNLHGEQSRVNIQSNDHSTNLRQSGSRRKSVSQKRRFDVGAEVRIINPGLNGVVTKLDPEPTVLGEYWHTIKTRHGERRDPGCNLELTPGAQK